MPHRIGRISKVTLIHDRDATASVCTFRTRLFTRSSFLSAACQAGALRQTSGRFLVAGSHGSISTEHDAAQRELILPRLLPSR